MPKLFYAFERLWLKTISEVHEIRFQISKTSLVSTATPTQTKIKTKPTQRINFYSGRKYLLAKVKSEY